MALILKRAYIKCSRGIYCLAKFVSNTGLQLALCLYQPNGRTREVYRIQLAADVSSLRACFVLGKVYIIAGNQGYVYDLIRDSLSQFITPFYSAWSAVAGCRGSLYCISGYAMPHFALTPASWCYIHMKEWQPIMPIPTARARACATVYNGCIYVFGGSNQGVLNTVESYDPQTNCWTVRPPMPIAVCEAACAVFRKCIYVIGGFHDLQHRVNAVQRYDPVSNSWTVLSERINCMRDELSAFVYRDRLFVICGDDGRQRLKTVESFDGVSWYEEKPVHDLVFRCVDASSDASS